MSGMFGSGGRDTPSRVVYAMAPQLVQHFTVSADAWSATTSLACHSCPQHIPRTLSAKEDPMADLTGVEIARVGQWQLASGELDVTEQMLIDAAAYASREGARSAPIKLGHTDPRFTGDGEPAMGWLGNLRVEGAGGDAVLIGDIKDMPDWLAEAAPKHWPDRSMEGWTDYEEDGRTYAMVVDGLALLGVTPPGMSSLRSLRDLPQALGVAASARIVAHLQAASDKPWSQFTQADYTDEQWRRACILHRTGMSGKEAHGLPIREPGGALNRNGVHAAAARINQVHASPEAKKSAANALLRAYGQLGEDPPDSLRRMAASQTPAPHSGSGRIKDKGAEMDPAKIREALGLAADASDEDVTEAVVAAGLAPAAAAAPVTPPPAPTGETPPAEAPPVVEPIAAAKKAAGTMVIDASAWDAQQDRIKRLEAADAKRRREERDQVVAAAISAGKFPPARKDHWVRLWDADPEGTRQVLDGLARNVVPVTAMGEPGSGVDDFDEEFAHLFPPTPKGA